MINTIEDWDVTVTNKENKDVQCWPVTKFCIQTVKIQLNVKQNTAKIVIPDLMSIKETIQGKYNSLQQLEVFCKSLAILNIFFFLE